MRPARRPLSVPFFGTTTAGRRGAAPGPARRTGRASSSSSPVFAPGRSRNVSVAAAPGCEGAAGAVAGGRRRASSGARAVAGAEPGVAVADCAAMTASAASRAAASTFSRASSSSRWRASSSAALRASSSRRRASSAADRMEIFSCSRRSASRFAASRCCSTSARWRAASSVCVSALPAPAAGRPAGTVVPRAAGAACIGPAGGVADPGAPTGARFLRTSTCTTLDRPWLKLCLTEPASTVLPSSRRPDGRRESRPLPAS